MSNHFGDAGVAKTILVALLANAFLYLFLSFIDPVKIVS